MIFSLQTVQSTLQVDVVHTADVPTVVLETENLKYDCIINVKYTIKGGHHVPTL